MILKAFDRERRVTIYFNEMFECAELDFVAKRRLEKEKRHEESITTSDLL